MGGGVIMTNHLSKTVASCFTNLRQIRRIQRSVNRPVLLYLVTLGLWVCSSYTHFQIPAGLSAVDPQCSSTPHVPSSQVRPRNCIVSGTSLAIYFWTYKIRTGGIGVSMLAQHDIRVPDKVQWAGDIDCYQHLRSLFIQSANNNADD